LINTTVSDRYADPRHCKMAAISPSHSSGRQPSPASSSSLSPLSLLPPSPVVHWTPEGVSVSHSLPALPRHPHFAPPQLALLIFTPRPRRRRHRHIKSSGRKYATLPPGSACLTRLRRIVPPDIYMRCDFIGRSWCRSKSHTHTDRTYEATHPPIACRCRRHRRLGYFGTPAITETLEKRTYTLYPHPAICATKMVVKTLYRSVFLPGNEPGLRAREILRNLRPGNKQRSHFHIFK